MPHIPVKDCCGCTACMHACPSSAIRMQPDQEGFLHPVVDLSLCSNCSKCERVCPITNPPKSHDTFADCVIAQNRSAEVLDESTSGGFVDALCRYVLEDVGGCVVGVAFDEEFLPYHKIVDTYDDAKAFRNSKYAQSELGNVFQQILLLLKDGRTVMFIGTPCQVAGLKSFVGNNDQNLITVDLVCRSIPSPKLWRRYLEWQSARYGAEIKKVVCRKKTYGYHSGALEIDFSNGKHYVGSNRVDYYMKSFHKDICSRRSCYECKFKSRHRCSDFTVFDSWRPHTVTTPPIIDNDKGFSNVLVHSLKGKAILQGLKEIDLYPSDADRLLSVMGSMVSNSIKMQKERETFYIDLDAYGFYKTVKRYSRVSMKDRVIESAKPIWYIIKRRIKGEPK